MGERWRCLLIRTFPRRARLPFDTDAPLQQTETVYLFNRETFFSEPERWASELQEPVVLPLPLQCGFSRHECAQ